MVTMIFDDIRALELNHPGAVVVDFVKFSDCAQCRKTLEHLKQALKELNLKAQIYLYDADREPLETGISSQSLPYIRINGLEVDLGKFGQASDGPHCRRFKTGLEISGYPTKEMIVKAINHWLDNDEARRWLLLL